MLSSVKLICKCTHVHELATKCKTGSGRQKTVQTADKVERVACVKHTQKYKRTFLVLS